MLLFSPSLFANCKKIGTKTCSFGGGPRLQDCSKTNLWWWKNQCNFFVDEHPTETAFFHLHSAGWLFLSVANETTSFHNFPPKSLYHRVVTRGPPFLPHPLLPFWGAGIIPFCFGSEFRVSPNFKNGVTKTDQNLIG